MAFLAPSLLSMKIAFSSLLSLIPVNLEFNFVICPPFLIIPLGMSPDVKSSASLLKKDTVTSESQVTTKVTSQNAEPLVITQRNGQQYTVNTVLPMVGDEDSDSAIESLKKYGSGCISSIGILQTMTNIMYSQFESASCLFVSQFGVAGVDGSLYLQTAEYRSNTPLDGSDQVTIFLSLASQPKEQTLTKQSLGEVDKSTQKGIDTVFP
jgi:hypothetical protein